MHSTRTLKWEPLAIDGLSDFENFKIEDHMRRIFVDWEGTPHMDGQQAKGTACDCVRFVSAVVDELSGDSTDLDILPADTAFHNKESAWKAFRQMRTVFKAEDVPKEGTFQPGDILIVGPRKGGPGHAVIVGPDKRLWHCDSEAVVWTGLGYLHSKSINFKKALRITHRELWK